jgi:nitroreductase
MEFSDIIRSRYSCRTFKPDTIDDDVILKVLEAARVAPSAVNFQPWHFIVIKSDENKAKIHEAYPRDWFKTAPVLIVACGDHSVSWKRADGRDYTSVDISIAVDHLILQATELGLGTCWVCNFNLSVLRHNLSLPITIEPIVIIPMGYPIQSGDTSRFDAKRKPLTEFVHWEDFE